MSRVYFSSDFHLGHKNIVEKYRPEFSSIEEHDSVIFDLLYSLSKNDVLYLLGDILFHCDQFEWYLERFRKVRARIKYLPGNHDSLRMLDRIDIFERILPLSNYRSFWLSHMPIHPSQMHGRKMNIHGHLHKQTLPDPMYFNVNLDVNGYRLVNFEDIKKSVGII